MTTADPQVQHSLQILTILIGGAGTVLIALLVAGIKALVETLIKSRQDMAVIKAQLVTITDSLKPVPQLERDVNILFEKIRNIER